jgi:replicative DNA helicase
LRKGDISEEEFQHFATANAELMNLPIHIDDTGGLSIAALAARARRLQRQKGLDLIIVDYLQLVTTSSSRRNDGRVQEVSEVAQGLKALAKDLDVPVLALAQLSRKVEDRDDKRPQLADLRESGAIEQDADVVMFIYREEYYLERKKPGKIELDKFAEWQNEMERVHGLAEVIVGKQRHGPTDTIELQFDANITRFSNLAKQEPPGDIPL